MTNLETNRLTVMVSSTARDLPEHRKEVMDACLRQGMFPRMMEHLPASDADAIAESLRMVDEADIYLGVFAHRYGYVPAGHPVSITEMEYQRAVERDIPRLIFFMHEDHPLKASEVETGEGAALLKAFKDRIGVARVANFFKSPEDLRAHVINSLSQFRQSDLATFHYVSDIPEPPEPHIAHPYTLLQMRDLVGRHSELNLLTDWVAKSDAEVYQARILNIVAIGGMGKSALTWKWFNEIAPREIKSLAGRMWWSFYESDATFENFIVRALAYVSERTREEIERTVKPGEREDQLLAILNRQPFLFVFDGLERILIAYARMDASRLADDELDQQTANTVAGARSLPKSAAQSFTGRHKLRKTADPRVGNFLRKLARVEASRVLVSTRLYPAELQNNVNGEPIPGSYAYFLQGMTDDDALSLWRAFGVSGARDELLRLFHTFENHPLLIQALASEIAQYKRAPGDFDAWRQHNPDFNPFSLSLVQVKSHILSFALQGLDEPTKNVLYTVAAFRMPASYDTLAALLVGDGKIFRSEHALDATLNELEDRGLLGWDKRANRYDLHPIVRGVIWGGLEKSDKQGIYGRLQAHFNSISGTREGDVQRLEDLTPAIELYDKLIGLERYDDAWELFDNRIRAGLERLHEVRLMGELMAMLFPQGLDKLPHLREPRSQLMALVTLTFSYQMSGQPGQAVSIGRRVETLMEQSEEEIRKTSEITIFRSVLTYGLCVSGQLREAEAAAHRALLVARQHNPHEERVVLMFWGLTLATRGMIDDAETVLKLASADSDPRIEGWVSVYRAQLALWLGDRKAARQLADHAWKLADDSESYKIEYLRAARLQGMTSLGANDQARAEEQLHYTLTEARDVNHAEESLPALIGLAELRRRQARFSVAREFLDDVWDLAEQGPYPAFHADAYNVLAQLEQDEGNHRAAVEAATRAYKLAWCDGPPFAYHWGLERARKHLAELHAPEPSMPPFDESKFEPIVEVEIKAPAESGGEES